MRTRSFIFRVVGCASVACLAFSAGAELTVPNIISSHMVLQRNLYAPIWGTADPGAEVSVTLAGQTVTATANEGGFWLVKVGPFEAGGPHTLQIASGGQSLTFEDVLVGEVWICSGQSNMQWPVKNSANAEGEIAAANYPNLRFFQVEMVTAPTPQRNCNGKWSAVTPETVPDLTAVGYFFCRELLTELGVPVGLIQTAWGGTPSEAWTSFPRLNAYPEFKPLLQRWYEIVANNPLAQEAYTRQLEIWEREAAKAKAEGTEPPAKPRPPLTPEHPHRPANIFNAMIAPLVPYGIQGAIWYQGESNASRAYQYRTLFPVMIEDWRSHWGQGDFSFYLVQLANWRERDAEPVESDWAELREAQLRSLALPNTGMAVTIDIGDEKDIHPRNKQDVGKRLALWALAHDYGRDVVFSGPIYDGVEINGDSARIRFKYTDGGLKTSDGGPLKGFAIAGHDRKFVWANAGIEGDMVVVSSPEVKNPAAVRYAWANNPECNLCNGAGLPASPFRTDSWPGITVAEQ